MGGGGGGLEQFSVSFGFGTKGFKAKGLGPGLDNLVTCLVYLVRVILVNEIKELDRGSIRSSPRDGLSTPYRLRINVWDCSTISLSTWET